MLCGRCLCVGHREVDRDHTQDVWLENKSGQRYVTFKSMDAAIVSPSASDDPPSPFFSSMEAPRPGTVTGMGFNLWNNIWETNYAFYYPFLRGVGDENMRFRFEVLV
eukprot:Sspe_Gene.5654::Locus_1877_Transcript_1_4_Confidence_0.750_Length_862::g.5654::m.5654